MTAVRAAVLGGGVAGLTAAAELVRAGVAVSLLEATDRLGGQIWTERCAGYSVDHGADGIPQPDEEARSMLGTLGLLDRLTSQGVRLTLGYRDGDLEPLSPQDVAQAIGISVREEARGQGTLSFPDGMDELVATLHSHARRGATIRLGCQVTRIAHVGAGWTIHTRLGNAARAQLVVLALPTEESRRLLLPVFPQFTDLSNAATARSTVSVTLALRRRDVKHPLQATGFVVLDRNDIDRRGGLVACSFSSSKFAKRAPAGRVLLRALYRPGERCPIDASDPLWAARAVEDLSPVLGLRGPPLRSWVARWGNALPRIDRGRPAFVHRLAGEGHHGGTIQLAGSACVGAGVLPAMKSGHQAARRLLELVAGRRNSGAPDAGSSTRQGST